MNLKKVNRAYMTLTVIRRAYGFKIVHFLLDYEELYVTTLTKMCRGSQPEVSQRLSDFRRYGLVKARRAGKHTYYSLNKEKFARIEGALMRFNKQLTNDKQSNPTR